LAGAWSQEGSVWDIDPKSMKLPTSFDDQLDKAQREEAERKNKELEEFMKKQEELRIQHQEILRQKEEMERQKMDFERQRQIELQVKIKIFVKQCLYLISF